MALRQCCRCGQMKDLREDYPRSYTKEGGEPIGSHRADYYEYHCKICDNKKKGPQKAKKKRENSMLWKLMYGNRCIVCGYDTCTHALEFHHLDREKKTVIPSQLIRKYNPKTAHPHNIKRVKRELDGCQLVCANCHREIHVDDNGVSSW